MSGLLPNYIMHQWTSDGKMASGGFIYFYQSGTLVPKTVYKDAGLTTAHTNPVQLSASGTEVIFLADGAYRVWVKDQYGQQIEPWLDGVVGGGSGSGGGGEGSNSSFVTVKLYNDLRSLSTVPDTVYVTGKIAEGDGGAGWFQLVPGSTAIDDDGVILTSSSGSNVYKRVFDGVIDAQWYGVRYGISADQTVFFNHALTGSVTHNYPVQVTGSVYINQNVSIPTKAALIATDDGFFTASLAVNMTFADDSKLTCTGRTFGSNVSPKIGKRVIDRLKLSYMGGSVADARMDKLLLATTLPDQIIEIDESVSILASTWVCPNTLEFTNNSYLTFTGASGLVWTSPYIKVEPTKMFQVDSTASVAFNFGKQFAYAEMVGAVGNGSTDDSVALSWVAATGFLELVDNVNYYAGGFVYVGSASIIRGNGSITFGPSSAHGFSGTQLELQDISVIKGGSTTWATLTTLTATNCALPSDNFTATNKSITGCSYADDTRYPVLDGTVGPALLNAHLPLLPNAGQLSTDNNGKIINGSPLKSGGNSFDLAFYGSGHYAGNNNFNAIKYFDNGQIIVVGNLGEVYRSADGGATWTDLTIFSGGSQNDEKFQIRDITYTGFSVYNDRDEYAYASGGDFEFWVAHSNSNNQWVSPSNPLNNPPTSWRTALAHSIAYDPTLDVIFTCTQWSRVCTATRGQYAFNSFTCGTGTLVAAGAGVTCRHVNGQNVIAGYDSNNGNMGTYWLATTLTNNASDWVKYSIGTVTTITDIIYANGKYYAVGTGGYIAYSTLLGASASWTIAQSPSTVDLSSIAYIPNDGFYACGSGGTLLHSRDGKYFIPRYSGLSVNLTELTYNSVNGVTRLLGSGYNRTVMYAD